MHLQFHITHDVYCLNGEMPETENIMSGETLDISQLCELEWYEWIIFRELVVSFPEDKMVLGIYLGPIIDVGLAMTAKILKPNVEVVHQSKY